MAAAAAEPSTEERRFRNALGAFGTGVTVITTVDAAGQRFAMTVNSFAAVSLRPPLVLWSIARGSPSAGVFLATEHFAVNVLAASQLRLARHFSRPSPDKFAEVAVRTGLYGAPLIEGAPAQFECRLEHRYNGGDHVILVGRVLRFVHAPSQPLLFAGGCYQRGTNLEADADWDAELSMAWGGLA